jgi:L-asparaginase
MLQLAINAGYSLDRIRDVFENPLREAIYSPTVNKGFYYEGTGVEYL